MKLIFDLTKTQPVGDTKIHGGGKYGEIIFQALLSRSVDVIAYYNFTEWLNPELLSLCKKKSILMIDSNHKSVSEVARENNGIIYSPIIEVGLLEKEKQIPYITTIHGLRVLEMPNDRYASYYKDYGLLNSIYKLYKSYEMKREYKIALNTYRNFFDNKNIYPITVSEHSKASILSFVPCLRSNDIPVFYSPSTIYRWNDIDLKSYTKEKYYLIVGANRWVKNALRALNALDEIFTERPDFEGKVIVTGLKNSKLFDKYIKNRNRFELIDYVSEQTLYSLYKGAYLFIYPSLNEGFGYPPLEAMSQGTPVIASAISSIPEICGDGVLYFNPMMISEIKMRIIQMEDESVRQHYIKKGFERFTHVKYRQEQDLEKLVSYLLSFSA